MLQLPEKPLPRRVAKSVGDAHDPVLRLIADYQSALTLWCDAQNELDKARFAAKDQTGYIPYGLISWRNYSAIGGKEIERARDAFIAGGLAPSMINREYKDAKRRHRDSQRAEKKWADDNGVTPVQKRADACMSKLRAAEQRIGNACPTTPAGIVGLLKLGLEDSFDSDWEWQRNAVEGVIRALENMSGGR